MKITCLVENITHNNNLLSEHGLSLFIETKKHKILFDMGQTSLFYDNAKKLNISIKEADIAILSHGHYDHGGGLEKFLEINKKAPIYINKYAFEPHFNGTTKYIGLDTSLKNNSRIIFTEETEIIDESLSLFSCNDFKRNHNLGSFGLTTKENDVFKDDDFRHEQYLMINEDDKKILISGCSHKGIMDITEWFKPDVLVGGFHFSKLPLDEKLSEYAKFLDGFDTTYYTCHCTGTEQFEHMKKNLKNSSYLSCGESIEI